MRERFECCVVAGGRKERNIKGIDGGKKLRKKKRDRVCSKKKRKRT